MNSGQDHEFLARLKDHSGAEETVLEADSMYFIYRWLTSYQHLSGYGLGDAGYARFGEVAARYVDPGVYVIAPAWERDYVRIVREFVAAGRAPDM